jgi:hypothetical protein
MQQFRNDDCRARKAHDGLIMAKQLTDEQETLLAAMVEQALDRARAVWKASDAFDLVSKDESFDRGFEAAMDFALSDEFERFIDRLKYMLDESGSSRH